MGIKRHQVPSRLNVEKANPVLMKLINSDYRNQRLLENPKSRRRARGTVLLPASNCHRVSNRVFAVIGIKHKEYAVPLSGRLPKLTDIVIALSFQVDGICGSIMVHKV
jgi:hypothetical protein